MPNTFRLKSLISALGLSAASLLGPIADAKQPEAPYEYGPAPDWTHYKELAEQTIRAQMFDPDAARFQWPNGYAPMAYKPMLSRRFYGYVTCGLVNGRNRFGAYTGNAYFVVVIDHDQVLYNEIGRGGGIDLLSDACRKAGLPPAPLASSLDAPTSGGEVSAVNGLTGANAGNTVPPWGLTLSQAPYGVFVSGATRGGVARQAGLVPGLIISKVNGISVKGMSLSAIVQMLNGITGTASISIDNGPTLTVPLP